MLQRRQVGASGIIYLIVLATLTSFFLMPSQGEADGAGGWPIVQNDSSGDSTVSSTTSQDSEVQTEELSTSLLELFWEAVKLMF
jgi:hypothetical protein